MATATQQPASSETARLESLYQLVQSGGQIVLTAPGREGIALPDSVVQALRQALGFMQQGKGVAISPVHRNLTTQMAADLLGVSRPFVVELLNRKEIPFHLVGTHRRIYLEDLLRYQAQRDKGRREILNQMAREAMEDGDYDRT